MLWEYLLICETYLLASLLSVYCLTRQSMSTESENYGPYIMDWESAALCKGPKSVDVAQETFEFDKVTGVCIFNFTFIKEAQIDEVKVVVYSESNGAKNILWNYRIKNPCKHIMVASLIKQQLSTEYCDVKKGFYTCKLNFHDSSNLFLGTSFFYGKFIFKTVVTSKKGNVHCFLTTVSFTKRP